MNARLLAITTVLLLVLSGCGQSYNPERDKDCPGCDLSKTDLTGANLSKAYLNGANLTDADLRGTDLSWAVLSQGDLSGANLTNADLTWADLTDVINADFTGAVNAPAK